MTTSRNDVTRIVAVALNIISLPIVQGEGPYTIDTRELLVDSIVLPIKTFPLFSYTVCICMDFDEFQGENIPLRPPNRPGVSTASWRGRLSWRRRTRVGALPAYMHVKRQTHGPAPELIRAMRQD